MEGSWAVHAGSSYSLRLSRPAYAASCEQQERELMSQRNVIEQHEVPMQLPHIPYAEPPEGRTSLHVDLLNEDRLMQNGREHLAQSGVVENRSSARRSRGRVHKASKRLVKLEL